MNRLEGIIDLAGGSWLSVTEDVPRHPKATIVFCHGLSGDKIGPQKLLALLSQVIATQCSYRVVRFDFRGSGLSSGEFFNTSFETMLSDSLVVANHFTTTPLIWMGISTGALVALMAASFRKKGERVVSISNGFAEEISYSFAEEDVVSIREGQFFLPKAYFTQREKLKPRANFFSTPSSIDCILGSLDHKHAIEYQSLKACGAHVHMIEGGDHLFTSPKARAKLLNKVCSLL